MARSSRAAAVVERYRDSYRVANVIVRIGRVVKALGMLVAVGLPVGAIGFAPVMDNMVTTSATRQASSSFSGSIGMSELLVLVAILGMLGGIVGLLVWIIGVRISAQGELLLSSLDAAVNSSPFMDDDDRAEAMGLPQLQEAAV